MDGVEFAALDTLPYGLARDAERLHRLAHGQEAVAAVVIESGLDVLGQPDAPGSAGRQLFARNDPRVEQAMQGRGSDAEGGRRLLDRQRLAFGVRVARFEARDLPVAAQIADVARFEASDANAEGEPLTIKKAAAALGVAASTLHRLLNA